MSVFDATGLSEEGVEKVKAFIARTLAEEEHRHKTTGMVEANPELRDSLVSLAKEYREILSREESVPYRVSVDGKDIAQGFVSLRCVPDPQHGFDRFVRRIAEGEAIRFVNTSDDHYHPISGAMQAYCRRQPFQPPVSAFCVLWSSLIDRVNQWCGEARRRGCDPTEFADWVDILELMP